MTPLINDLFVTTEARLNNLFNLYLKKDDHQAPLLQEIMAYAVFNGGKRIRPNLIYAIGKTFDSDLQNFDAAAVAIELIHCYSLIHDDLPAMDNSDLRRGKPSCHKAYNEALAILAGDALQALAFQILANHPTENLTAEDRLAMLKTLSEAGGPEGIAAGQTLDITMQKNIKAEELIKLCELKTGALLEASVDLGLIGAKVNDAKTICALKNFSTSIGLAFQLQDDLIDIQSAEEVSGKPQGLDAANNKVTYPMLVGVDETQKKIKELHDVIMQSIQVLGNRKQILEELALFLLQRKK